LRHPRHEISAYVTDYLTAVIEYDGKFSAATYPLCR
jgi:hypothetical protein